MGPFISLRQDIDQHGDVMSFIVNVICSVPQGSVLGPLFFILYMADLADRVAKYGMSVHAYADDKLHICTSTSIVMISRLRSTNLSVASWTLATGCLPTD